MSERGGPDELVTDGHHPIVHLDPPAPAAGKAMVLPAIGVMVVGYSDNVLTARSFATRNSYRVDANTEMLALGAANLAAGLPHGFPVSSSASRTAIGDSLGSRSQVHSLVAVAVVVLVLLVGGPVLAAFPTAALGALVIYAAVRLIELSEFRRIAAFRSSELALALATTAGVLLLDVLYGVLVAIGLSILDLLRRLARPHDVDDYPHATRIPGLVVYRYDITAVDALDDLRTELTGRGIVFAMARFKQDLHDVLARGGFVERVGDDRIFPTLPTAVAAFREWSVEHGPGSARRS